MNPELQPLLDVYRVARPSLAAILPVLLIAGFAIVVLLADLFELGTTRGPAEGEEGTPIMAPYLALVGTALGLGATLWQAVRLETLGGSYFNGMLVIDGFGLFLATVILAGTLLTLLLTVGYCRRENIALAEYYHLILLSAAGMLLLAQSTNLVMIFVALELMSLGVYVLTGFHRRRLRSVEGALKYFILGAFSTGFLVYGIAFVYGASGTMDLARLPAALGVGPPPLLLLAGVGLLVVGFGFKVALVPFHMWSPDVYEAAPPPVTGFMATAVKAAAFAAFARLLMATSDPLAGQWVPVLWVLAVLTMFVGNVAAIRQDDIKRMLAYSSIAHAGYLAVALIAASGLGDAAFLYYLAVYTLMTLGAFGVVVAVGEKGMENTSIERDYAGLGYRHPLLAVAMALFMFSLTGIPPTAGFFGKFAIFSAAVDAGYVSLAFLMVIASAISAYYYLKVVVAMYMRAAEPRAVPNRMYAMAGVALFVTALGVVALGVFPGGWLDLARASADGLHRVAGIR
ncbi:MAG TPA: NADH-quinone oxidoreductase subunit N [Gemmatimonadota bacterium]|nr:NADH-quinone oxidoreductase subunit N [Gemmatimonadota bacterium]